jgi:hypothetical protein
VSAQSLLSSRHYGTAKTYAPEICTSPRKNGIFVCAQLAYATLTLSRTCAKIQIVNLKGNVTKYPALGSSLAVRARRLAHNIASATDSVIPNVVFLSFNLTVETANSVLRVVNPCILGMDVAMVLVTHAYVITIKGIA